MGLEGRFILRKTHIPIDAKQRLLCFEGAETVVELLDPLADVSDQIDKLGAENVVVGLVVQKPRLGVVFRQFVKELEEGRDMHWDGT
jgi:hypothetical protein